MIFFKRSKILAKYISGLLKNINAMKFSFLSSFFVILKQHFSKRISVSLVDTRGEWELVSKKLFVEWKITLRPKIRGNLLKLTSLQEKIVKLFSFLFFTSFDFWTKELS